MEQTGAPRPLLYWASCGPLLPMGNTLTLMGAGFVDTPSVASTVKLFSPRLADPLMAMVSWLLYGALALFFSNAQVIPVGSPVQDRSTKSA